MRIAAIDIGTNSVKLLVADVVDGRLRPVHENITLSRLGQGFVRTGRLGAAAQERTLDAVGEFVKAARQAGARNIVAAATEAVRRAGNGAQFLAACRRTHGLDVRVITSREEAALAYEGATTDLARPRPAAVDVGGGSTEVMVGARGVLEWSHSMPVGCVTLLETCLTKDPPGREGVDAAAAEVRRRLPRHRPRHGFLVGIGGTVATLAAMSSRWKPGMSWETVDQRLVTRKFVERMIERLSHIPVEFRSILRGLDDRRADIILPGMVILNEVMRAWGAKAVLARTRGLRHALARRAAAGSRR